MYFLSANWLAASQPAMSHYQDGGLSQLILITALCHAQPKLIRNFVMRFDS